MEATAFELEAIAFRLEAIAFRSEAMAFRLEAIAISIGFMRLGCDALYATRTLPLDDQVSFVLRSVVARTTMILRRKPCCEISCHPSA